MRRVWRAVAGSAGAAWAVIGAACTTDPPVVAVRDTIPPVIRILFPGQGAYDENGDALVDLRVTWDDSGGAVSPSAVRVRILGASGADTNLLRSWRVERLDSAGLTLHELAASLRPAGVTKIEIMVPDTAGNVTRDTVAVTLPYVAPAGTLATGLPVGLYPAEDVVICPDDGRLFMSVGEQVFIVNRTP